MKILLTGGAGFIGSCYLWKLNSMGIDDVVVVDADKNPETPNLKNKKFKDYHTREELFAFLEKDQMPDVDLVAHLGACTDTTEKNEDYLRKNNLEFSQKLAQWTIGRGKQFHYASSAAIYGDGKKGYSDSKEDFNQYKALNLYGESKRLFDQWIIEENLWGKVVGYRYFNVFGPNEYHKGEMRSMISKAFDQIKKEGQVKLFASSHPDYPNGAEERDFIYIKDVCEVMAAFLENPDRKGIFNVGTGKARTFKDLVKAVFSALGKEEKIEYIPMPEALRGQYQYHTKAEIKNLRSSGYKKPFTSLEDAVKDYVQSHLIKENPYL